MSLTDIAIRNAKPCDKTQKLFDERGMYLEISPKGGKWWRFKYRFDGKEKRFSLGVYPDIGLKEARERRDEARKLLARGVDPGEAKKIKKQVRKELVANSFEIIAREWFAKFKGTWTPSHAERIFVRLEKDVFPWLGGKPAVDITPSMVLEVIRRVEKRGALETAHRVKGNISQVMRYAIATDRAEHDPCPDLRGALPSPKGTNLPAITNPKEVGALLRALDAFQGTLIVKSALLLSPLVFVRPGELRQAEWAGIDLDKGEWRYFVTKTKTDHLVPLSTQAVAILREIFPFTGHRRYVFPGRDPQKPMSNAAVNAALRRMGYDTKTEITGHGFRAMARTILAEELNYPGEVIEHQLAHKVPDALGTAYNRTKFLKMRKEMMQAWADYLDKLKVGADVIPLAGSQQQR